MEGRAHLALRGDAFMTEAAQIGLFSGEPEPLPRPVLRKGQQSPVDGARLDIDPARVRIWEGNGRDYASLTETGCTDLIDSIRAEGRQLTAAIVRPLRDDADHDFELIVGARRHWSVSWLRAHDRPDVLLAAEVRHVDDHAAFRMADIENRVRQDLSALERAKRYRHALHTYYDGQLRLMANVLGLSPGWLSKHISVAALPETVLAAFPDRREVQINSAYEVARAYATQPGAVIARASEIVEQRQANAGDGETPAAIARRLTTASRPRPSAATAKQYSPSVRVERIEANGEIVVRIRPSGGDVRAGLEALLADYQLAAA
jgi:ParB family transcriptional regulator, chromosome partitioning protein